MPASYIIRLAEEVCSLQATVARLEQERADLDARNAALQVKLAETEQHLDELTAPQEQPVKAPDPPSLPGPHVESEDAVLYRLIEPDSRKRALDFLAKAKLKTPAGETLKELIRFVEKVPDRGIRSRALVECARLHTIRHFDERLKYPEQAGAHYAQKCGSYRILLDIEDGQPVLRDIGRHEDGIYHRFAGRREH